MGSLLKVDFKVKLNPKLKNFDPKIDRQDYHEEIFKELFEGFPQFKDHVAAYVERHYCIVINDEDHSDPQSLVNILTSEEVRLQNDWIVNRSKIKPIPL
jgi:hypothetical protein